MLMNEWKLEDALKVEREEGLEDGREEGLAAGQAIAVKNLFALGMTHEQISQALKLPLEAAVRYESDAREFGDLIVGDNGTYRLSIDEKKAVTKQAIDSCIAEGTLKSVFEDHGSEIMDMFMNEWVIDDALRTEREDALVEGRTEGAKEYLAEVIGKLTAFGMEPEQISHALKLPLETVMQYQGGV